MIRGYKAFNKDMTNQYGMKFQEGVRYIIDGPLKFGVNGNGFHFCTKMEDTLRYVEAKDEDVVLTRVNSLGKQVKFDDEYYGFYDMYAASDILIEHVYTRDEIIEEFLNAPSYRTDRFLRLYKLNEEEINLFRDSFKSDANIQNVLSYYQEHDLNTYERYYNRSKVLVKK